MRDLLKRVKASDEDLAPLIRELIDALKEHGDRLSTLALAVDSLQEEIEWRNSQVGRLEGDVK